jgi:hypothetical protein
MRHLSMIGVDILSTTLCGLSFLIVYFIFSSSVQYWRLRNIPGPPIAAWTNLWLMWHLNSKDRFHNIKRRLHQRYGPVQRYGPNRYALVHCAHPRHFADIQNRVMFSDIAAIPIILGTSNIFPRVGTENGTLEVDRVLGTA